MHKPSRTMPPVPSVPWTFPAFAVLALFGVGIAAIVYSYPIVLLVFGAIGVLMVVLGIHQRLQLAALARERAGESICTFARSFDYRAIDTWVIRAVFDELQPYCRFGRRVLPLRADDDLGEVLRIDPEDLDELACDIAERTGRSMEDCVKNPFHGRVKTVADLVSFLVNQPKTATASGL